MTGRRLQDARVVYFDRPGSQNTDSVIELVAQRAAKGGISHVVVASSTGKTAERLLARMKGTNVPVVVVTSHSGFEKEGECEMSREVESSLTAAGAKVVRASHVLSGIERSITRRLGGASRVEAISEVLRALFGQGMKVCVEIAVMAADSGAIKVGDSEALVVGGYSEGADTALVVRPAHANAFFKFEVREILAMPRLKRVPE